jgi:hypothetical protein
MKKRTFRLAATVAFVSGLVLAVESATNIVTPKDGFVPNAETAIKIAVAVWEPIFGADRIAREKPYRARLVSGTWIVEGSLPPGQKGGVALAEIAKGDGRILKVSHGK